MIGNKINDRITKFSKTSQQSNSETITNERDKEISKDRYERKDRFERFISPEKKAENYYDPR